MLFRSPELSIFEVVDSEIPNYQPDQALLHLTQKYSYVDQYGAIGTHNPEELFTRLFRNKYEQDPSRAQVMRGVEALAATEGNNTQLSFLSAFALDNSVLSAGSYNYTGNLAIPNVPLDAAAFGETALVYSALIGQAPTKAQVARLTLTPEFEVRPLGERARIIMEMPAYAARFGLAMPEVDFVGVSNGEDYEGGILHPIQVDAVSLGADDLGGTLDDGSIYAVELYLNGELNATRYLSDANGATGFYDFNLSAGIASGDYRLEVVAEDVNGLRSRAERWISVRRGDDANVSISGPAIGTVLYVDELLEVGYEATESVTAYLEVNGRIPWSGRVGFEGTALPADESSISISDGTGRGSVTFEFDNNGSASQTTIDDAESIVKSGTGTLTAGGTYLGVDYREYVVEIDGNGAPDTFRWSSNGGASFNDSGIAIVADTNITLSAGVLVEFNSTDAYELGDRWRIKVKPVNEIVEVGRYGTFADKLATTQSNLIKAINRARNEGKLSVYAREMSEGAASGFPMQNLGERQIELIHDGGYAIREVVGLTSSTSAVLSEDLNATTSAVGASGALTADLRRLAGLSPVLDVRVVAMDGSGNLIYSMPRSYELRDRDRPYVELLHPMEDLPAGRRAVLQITEVNATGAITGIEVLDPGYGYAYDYEEGADNNLSFRFISANGSGASLRAQIEENGTLVVEADGSLADANHSLVGGSGYVLGDLILAPAALIYETGEPTILRARVNDPFNEVSSLRFYGNGVELVGTSSSFSGETTMIFAPDSESLSFITARALYGDERDAPPVSMEVEGSFSQLSSTDRGVVSSNRWSWKRNWQQQHLYEEDYRAPSWYWSGVSGYWSWPPDWLVLPDAPGALSAQSKRSLLDEEEDNATADVDFLFPPSDYAYDFAVGTEIPLLVEVTGDDLVEVHLFVTDVNETYLGQMSELNAGALGGYRTGLFSYGLNSQDLEKIGRAHV